MAANSTTGTYRAADGINVSSLKKIVYGRDRVTKRLVLSPLHYCAGLDGVDADKPAFRFGRAAHVATLEPDTFARRFARFDGDKRQRTIWQAFQEAHATETILDDDDYDRALALAAAVRAHPIASLLLAKGEAEIVHRWRDDLTGLLLKARLDWVLPSGAFLDLKTSGKSIEVGAFDRAAEDYLYWHQMAYYRRARAAALSCPLSAVDATIIVVESAHPHAVAVRDCNCDDLAAADEEIDEMLALVKACRASGEWPGPYPGRGEMRRPAYVYAAEELTMTTTEE